MNKLQAAMRDRAALSWTERKVMYKIGSVFKGCAYCGDTESEELPSGRIVVRYTSGFNVYRSYVPSRIGWTYWCYECGAKDGQCWDGAEDIGKDAVVGCRDAVAAHRAAVRRDAAKRKAEAPTSDVASRDAHIAALKAELARLTATLKGEY